MSYPVINETEANGSVHVEENTSSGVTSATTRDIPKEISLRSRIKSRAHVRSGQRDILSAFQNEMFGVGAYV